MWAREGSSRNSNLSFIHILLLILWLLFLFDDSLRCNKSELTRPVSYKIRTLGRIIWLRRFHYKINIKCAPTHPIINPHSIPCHFLYKPYSQHQLWSCAVGTKIEDIQITECCFVWNEWWDTGVMLLHCAHNRMLTRDRPPSIHPLINQLNWRTIRSTQANDLRPHFLNPFMCVTWNT